MTDTATAEKPAALPPELQQLQAEAVALEAQAAPADQVEQGGEVAAPVDYVSEARGIVDLLASTLEALYPSTASILTEAKRAALAVAWAPVMAKYNFTMGGLFGAWGAEINALFVTVPLALPLIAAIRADRAAAAAEQAAKPAPPPPPASSPAMTPAPPASDLYAKA